MMMIMHACMQAWSNGRLPAPYHKVTIDENESRYTIGIFINYNPDFVVKAPEELVDEGHPQLYNPFEVSGLYAFFKKKMRLKITLH